jgi:D-amino peptidase
MKVFISCDMEGISGVTGPDDVDPKKEAYNRFRKVMTGDVNAAIEGALLSGADEILVNDSHNGMRNILIEELNPRAQLISGHTKPLDMMQGIDSSFDVAMFVGYHAMAGTDAAVLNHTLYGSFVYDVWLNETLVGETAINAGMAGYFDVPIGAVTGDDKLAKEATSLLGNVETAVVKEGIDRYAARCLPLKDSRERIMNAAQRAIQKRKEFKPLKYQANVTFKVRFASTTEASISCLLPMVKRVDARTVSFSLNDYFDAFRMLDALLALASTGRNNALG